MLENNGERTDGQISQQIRMETTVWIDSLGKMGRDEESLVMIC